MGMVLVLAVPSWCCGSRTLAQWSSFLFSHCHQTYRYSKRSGKRFICLRRHIHVSSFWQRTRKRRLLVGREDLELSVQQQQDEDEATPPSRQDLQYIQEVKTVLELLRKNRDMLFSEVKLTIMIEDPREVERRGLLGIEDPDAPTRDDLVEALEQVHQGQVPNNRVALRMLAEEMLSWPNLEVEAPKKQLGKSLYAKATYTGVDPKEAAKRLKIDWDAAAEIEDADISDDSEVPPALGYGALYLVTAFPVIIGISVVLILFYNSLQ